MRVSKFPPILAVILCLVLALPVYSASLSLVVVTDKQTYYAGLATTFTGSVTQNGSAVPDALVLFEVDTPEHNPWIMRTFATGPNPSPPLGQWRVQLLNVTSSDVNGKPLYSFSPGGNAGFVATVRNNAAVVNRVVVTMNLFFGNGLPFFFGMMFNGTLNPGQTATFEDWPVTIPVNAVVGKAMVYASAFNDYPKNGGLPYSPEQSAAFNITSGIPAQAPPSNPLGNFSLTVPLAGMPTLPLPLGNYTTYAATLYNYSMAAAKGTFNVTLTGDVNHDGKVDMKDIALIAAHFGAYGPNYLYPGSPASPHWAAQLDIDPNGDNHVDMKDIAIAAVEFGMAVIPPP